MRRVIDRFDEDFSFSSRGGSFREKHLDQILDAVTWLRNKRFWGEIQDCRKIARYFA